MARHGSVQIRGQWSCLAARECSVEHSNLITAAEAGKERDRDGRKRGFPAWNHAMCVASTEKQQDAKVEH